MNITPTLNAAIELLTAIRDYENLKQPSRTLDALQAGTLLPRVVFKRRALRKELAELGFGDNYPFPEPGREYKSRTFAALQTLWRACIELETERLTNFEELPELNDQQEMLEQGIAMLEETDQPICTEPMTVQEVAKWFGMNRNVVAELLKSGEIPNTKLANRYRIPLKSMPARYHSSIGLSPD